MTTTNLDKVVQVISRHTGGWTREDGVVCCRGWDCSYHPKLGEFHGTHVAKEILATLGLPE